MRSRRHVVGDPFLDYLVQYRESDLNFVSLTLKATQQIQIECGAAKITLKMDGSIILDGVTGIQATSGPTSLKLGPDGSVIQGPKVGVTGMSMVEIVRDDPRS